jgi:hypothetical protein
MRNCLLTLGAVFFAAITVSAQDCPICPGGTNGTGGGPYTNVPVPPQEYALDAVLVRVQSILTPGWVQVYTNYGWMVDSNNLLVSAGASAVDSATAAPWGNLYYNIAVTNTDPTRMYVVQWSTSLNGDWYTMGAPFIGTTNNSEYVVQMVGGPNIPSIPLFWRAKQQPGFVAWVHAATNGFVGGTAGGCPGTYHGYINWAFHIPQWGYVPDTNVLHHTATDVLWATNSLEFGTDYGLFMCASNTVDWTNNPALNPPLYGDAARFTVFFKTYPTNQNYPLYIVGYLPPGTNDISPHIAGQPRHSFTVQPWQELDSIQMKGMGLSTNDLMTGHPAD